jgi:hypothetical protein
MRVIIRAMMMEAVSTFETSVYFYHPEDSHLLRFGLFSGFCIFFVNNVSNKVLEQIINV